MYGHLRSFVRTFLSPLGMVGYHQSVVIAAIAVSQTVKDNVRIDA